MAVKKKSAPAKAPVKPASELSGDDKTLAQAEGLAMNAYAPMGVPQFKAWILAYFHPYQRYEAEKKNADMGSSTLNLALVGLVHAVVTIILMALALALALPFIGLPITIVGAVMMLIAYPVGAVILGFVGSLVYYIVAKLLGGKGSFWEQTYCITLVSGGVSLMMAPLNILQVVPLIGWIFSLVGMVIALYGMISQYRMIRAVHSLSQLRAIVVILVPAVLILAFIFFVVGIAAIASLGAYGVPMK